MACKPELQTRIRCPESCARWCLWLAGAELLSAGRPSAQPACARRFPGARRRSPTACAPIF